MQRGMRKDGGTSREGERSGRDPPPAVRLVAGVHFQRAGCRPVSGLVDGMFGPCCLPACLAASSGVEERPASTYRCGGSAGMAVYRGGPASRFTRRGGKRRGGHLRRRL
jgi:hypothetical protein